MRNPKELNAEEEYRNLQVNPDATAHFDLGIAYTEMGLLKEAITSFQAARSMGVNQAECMHMISRCLQEEGKFKEAEEVLRESLAHTDLFDNEIAALNRELGIVLDNLGDKKGALRCLEIARDIIQRRIQCSSFKDHSLGGALNEISSLIAKIKWKSLSPWQQKIHIILDKVLRRGKRFEDLKIA